MQPVTPTAIRYDRTTMMFHWATALLVLGNWLGAQTIDWFPRGPLRVDARSVHIAVGVLLMLLLLARVVWRLTSGRRLPQADNGVFNVVAKGTHWLLYALLFTMVGLGLLLTWTRGDSIFNAFTLPAYQPGNMDLVHQVLGLHNTVGYCILALAGLHAAAALVHHFFWHDGVLARMLPGSQSGA